ncbi:MAG: putative selenate reductase subunit YgfK [Bacteroidetes bacterium]|nr:putative selenate reductase subunit YgfK [Bacteroidota bacterium]
MEKHFQPIDFQHLLFWIFKEYKNHDSIFGIPSQKFFKKKNNNPIKLFDNELETPIGPAAGPHTQLAQNIISAYLTGGRFFELKTVQTLDSIIVDKPCIDAEDECYNVEWSQELMLEQSFDEYLKAWIIIHLLSDLLNLSSHSKRSFIFNMSVGYDLEGIKSDKMNLFIDSIKDSTNDKLFNKYINILNDKKFLNYIENSFSKNGTNQHKGFFDKLESAFELSKNIPPNISSSVTLSTMHGCPPDEIERIAKYLIKEKHLHTFIKLNPTLLGYNKVKNILEDLQYDYIELDENSFKKDLKFYDAISLIRELKNFSKSNDKEFGIKLSNTLAVKNRKNILPGNDMYMSGRSLFPLTINLAKEISNELNGEIRISYSGGCDASNLTEILSTGIFQVTVVTDLLKPGGYFRLFEMAKLSEEIISKCNIIDEKINLEKLNVLAESSINNFKYSKRKRETSSTKIPLQLPIFDCYIAPCSIACPAGQNVSEYIRLIEEEKFVEAFEIITSTNPLPNITGYICDHQCMNKCTRHDYDSALDIRELKKIAAEKGYHFFQNSFSHNSFGNKNKIKAAVIGAGPAGLAAAYFLSRNGIDVTIFERSSKAGGTVRHVIPEFRIPQEIIDKDIDFVTSLGIKIIYEVNENLSVRHLREVGFKYIFIGIGAPKSNQLQLSKCDREIYNSIDFLKSFNKKGIFDIGKTAAIIGGGNSAMDSARAAKRLNGVEKIFILYRRTKDFMPADREEFDAAISEGIIFKELLSPISFEKGLLKCQKMILGEFDKDGRKKVIPNENEFEELQIDSLISAIGEQTEKEFFIQNNLIVNGKDRLQVNIKTNETNLENVFVGGDALRGPSTVIESIADGKKAAESILIKEGIKLTPEIKPGNIYDTEKRIQDIVERKGKIIDRSKIVNIESSRCLGCNILCNKCAEVCPNRANIALDSKLLGNGYKNAFQILHLDGLCNECGNCETFCPYSNAPYKTKPTLFWDKNIFNENNNDGFFISMNNYNDILKINFRLNNKVGMFLCSKDGNVFSLDPANDNEETENFLKFISNIIKNYSYLLNLGSAYVAS